MLVILTNSEDATADYLCGRLRRENLPFARLDTDVLTDSLEIEYSEFRTIMHLAKGSLAPEDVSDIWLNVLVKFLLLSETMWPKEFTQEQNGPKHSKVFFLKFQSTNG